MSSSGRSTHDFLFSDYASDQSKCYQKSNNSKLNCSHKKKKVVASICTQKEQVKIMKQQQRASSFLNNLFFHQLK